MRVAEADAVTEATGAQVAPYGALVLVGFRGIEAEASRLIDATIEEATAGGQGTAVQYAHWANAVLLNGFGRYREALLRPRLRPRTRRSCSSPSGRRSSRLRPRAGATRRTGTRCARAHRRGHFSRRQRLGAGNPGAVPGAACHPKLPSLSTATR